MVKNIALSDKHKFLVYWERGYRNAAQIARVARINERTAQRYAKKMLNEGSLDRKIGSGGHNKLDDRVQRRVISHAEDAKKPYSTRSLANSDRVSREFVRKIFKKIIIHISEVKNYISHII
jgi:hypothetical protein